MPKRIRDPQLVATQLNIKIPFFLREELIEAAHQRRVSQSEIVRKALEMELAKELTDRTKRMTGEAGATK